MAQHFTTRSFYGRSTCLTIIIPGPISELDGDNSDNEEEATLLGVNYDSEDSDCLSQNAVNKDNIGSDDAEPANETTRSATSRGSPKGIHGPSKNRGAEYSWRTQELDAVEIKKEVTFSIPDEVGSALHCFKAFLMMKFWSL